MATEEVTTKPPSLPSYEEMIFTAITSLNSDSGSNKTAISEYIESSYGDRDLPAGHSTLLSHALNKMKESGQLVLVKNNYMRPDPNAPPKRGRGRPPKPKAAIPADIVVGPPRPRGRPPKVAKDPAAAAAQVQAKPPPKATVGTGRPRGRPPKKARSDDEELSPKKGKSVSSDEEVEGEDEDDEEEEEEQVVKEKTTIEQPKVVVNADAPKPRGRGRPPKAKTPIGTVGFA